MKKITTALLMVAMLLLGMGTALAETPPRELGECERWVPTTYKTVVDQEAWTQVIEHPAEYETVHHPAVEPVVEPGVWANWAPNNTQGPQDYEPIWPEDERGTWIVHDQGVPPGHAGPDGVYKRAEQPNARSPYFYRQAEVVITEGKDAWTEEKLVKEAWTDTINHPATYKDVVDVPGYIEIIPDCPEIPDPVYSPEAAVTAYCVDEGTDDAYVRADFTLDNTESSEALVFEIYSNGEFFFREVPAGETDFLWDASLYEDNVFVVNVLDVEQDRIEANFAACFEVDDTPTPEPKPEPTPTPEPVVEEPVEETPVVVVTPEEPPVRVVAAGELPKTGTSLPAAFAAGLALLGLGWYALRRA